MINSQRILYKDNSAETDYSVDLNDYRTGSATFSFVSDEDYIYIASDYPFNHKWIDIGDTANAESASITVDIWDSNAWVSAVDIIDRTSVAGVPLAQDGIIQWKTERTGSWDREQDSEDVTGVSAIGIYNMYWIRIGYSADLTADVELAYIGNRFSIDNQLFDQYPDLNNTNLMAAFETGKTDWNDQHYAAADLIIRELKRRNIVISRGQILDFELFIDPSVHKTAEIIYHGLGKGFEENEIQARKSFIESFNIKRFNVDLNKDANLSEYEKKNSTGWLTR